MKFNNGSLTMKTVQTQNSVYIPERFSREISLHIFKNYYAEKHPEYITPLILAISGPPGAGKSFQAKNVIESLGVSVTPISGSEFENEHAGIPIRNMLTTYTKISEDILYKKIRYGAILIDDIDSALGQWGGIVQYTMNRQLLIKALIDLADNPKKVTVLEPDEYRRSYDTFRIPFVITLNDDTKMYEPLMRNGRTTLLHWIPNKEEIEKIINNIFRGIILSNNGQEISASLLYEELASYARNSSGGKIKILPISLFSDIKAALYDDWLWSQLNSGTEFDNLARSFEWQLDRPKEVEYSVIFEMGKRLLHMSKNYISQP